MIQRDSLKVYKIYTKDKKGYEIVAGSFTERANSVIFWDITGNIEIGFVPISSLNFIKVIKEYDELTKPEIKKKADKMTRLDMGMVEWK